MVAERRRPRRVSAPRRLWRALAPWLEAPLVLAACLGVVERGWHDPDIPVWPSNEAHGNEAHGNEAHGNEAHGEVIMPVLALRSNRSIAIEAGGGRAIELFTDSDAAPLLAARPLEQPPAP